jgi:hypothetical protein
MYCIISTVLNIHDGVSHRQYSNIRGEWVWVRGKKGHLHLGVTQPPSTTTGTAVMHMYILSSPPTNQSLLTLRGSPRSVVMLPPTVEFVAKLGEEEPQRAPSSYRQRHAVPSGKPVPHSFVQLPHVVPVKPRVSLCAGKNFPRRRNECKSRPHFRDQRPMVKKQV